MQRSFTAPAFIILISISLLSACNLPLAASTPPQLVIAPTEAPISGSTMIYADASTLVFSSAGPIHMGDRSTQNVDPFCLYQSDTSNAQYPLCIATVACTPPAMQHNPDIGNLN